MSKQTLIRPILTEKTARLMEEGHYAFQVRDGASKVEIRKAVQAQYPNVIIKDVRTANVRGKKKRQFTQRGAAEGRTAGYKKAIITLDPEGEQIDFFENIY